MITHRFFTLSLIGFVIIGCNRPGMNNIGHVNIGLHEIRVLLLGYSNKSHPGEPTFFSLLGTVIPPEFDKSQGNTSIEGSRIELFHVISQDLKDNPGPDEDMFALTRKGFLRAAAFLAKCKPEGLTQWRDNGNAAEIRIKGWFSSKTFYMLIPTEFSSECSRLQLQIEIDAHE